jgi:hypothetical protein
MFSPTTKTAQQLPGKVGLHGNNTCAYALVGKVENTIKKINKKIEVVSLLKK